MASEHHDDYESAFVPPHQWNCTVPLNKDTALDYFAVPGNPFYDRTCNNALLHQQGMSLRQLPRFRGVQYTLHAHAEPPLGQPGQPYVPPVYVVAKVWRTGERPSDVKVLALYYIVGAPPVIYQAPNLHAVVAARLDMCAHHVLAAHDALVRGVRFVPAQGFTWSYGEGLVGDRGGGKKGAMVGAKNGDVEGAEGSDKEEGGVKGDGSGGGRSRLTEKRSRHARKPRHGARRARRQPRRRHGLPPPLPRQRRQQGALGPRNMRTRTRTRTRWM